ncbi:transcriptional regulator [Desulfocucumis palustris]|uniref:Transcriptional regulator n=1 Tax=Desulfocucumis palustris TaxID=1898651 RepID=A0A2L2XBT0_9FIRM|nr:helix-turn-helix domain-containing protein [Desulfocucumis palustris]GBF33143.1 transcriptional regulator [Desulfocucumis palustris]
MNYIEIVNETIQYIESNLHRKLSLEELASRHYISPTHFYRIFRAVTNKTLKSYILERKLSEAAIALKKADRNVLEIALQYGFNSHEQFTRDFLKMFQVTPSRYKKENIPVSLIKRLYIIERDFRNKNNAIIVDHYCRKIKQIKLLGKELLIHHPLNPEEMEELTGRVFDLTEEYIYQGASRRLFSITRSDESNPSRKFSFFGIAAEEHFGDRSGFVERSIPESKYAIFRYPGFMGLIFGTVFKDLDKCLSVSGLKLNNNTGIEYFELFTEEYKQTRKFYLYVPVL